MSSSICIRCAISRFIPPARPAIKRSIHTTKFLRKKDDKPLDSSPTDPPKSDSSNVPATLPSSKYVVKKKTKKRFGPQDIKPYSPEEKARLEKKYTPAQLSAIEAGEAAVDPKDLYEQGALRQDPYAIEYQTDDFSKIMPVIDKPVPAPEENWDPNMRFKNEDEIAASLGEFLKTAPENATQNDYRRFLDNMRLKVGKEEAERNPRTYVRDPIPRGIPALEAAVKIPDDVEPGMKEMMKLTGLTLKQIRSTRVKILVQHRVVNQTRLGKIQSQYVLAVAGNQKGLLGIGEGKSAEPTVANAQAQRNAIRNMQPIPRYEERTIYGDVRVKVGAVELELMNRPPGFGVRCQHLIYEMCKCAGIEDMAARVTRSRNKMNTIKAAYKALLEQRIPDEVARGLGKKLVDVRKVYYSGAVNSNFDYTYLS